MTRIGSMPRKVYNQRTRTWGCPAKPVFTVLLLALCAGCTSWREYLHNGFKVGPNYRPPNARVAQHWIDAVDIRTEENPEILKCWWTVFNDRKLNELVAYAYRQNLSLREAGFRILQARASRSIVVGEIFPQRQTASGSYTRNATAVDPSSAPTPGRFFDNWNYGFGLAWELDFWGRFRRAIAAADANLDASVFGYDDVLVTMLGDVAANYVIVRTTQERINLLRTNVELQRGILQFVENRLNAGFRQTELDLDQALSTLRQSEAAVEQLEITLREAENNLCVLLGMPPVDLTNMLRTGPIPAPPPEVVVGIPADLLRRRPDVRRAERLAAAQAEEIGIAQAELYPAFSINGNFGYTAKNFSDLFRSTAFNGSVGPSFQWNLLNYGRIVNTVRLQDARFQELVIAYQNTVLQANREVENGLVEFLRAQRRSRLLDESVVAARKAVNIVVEQYKMGATDFNRYALIEQNLVTQQDLWAQARGEVCQGLIAVFRALGGGWELRLGGGVAAPAPAAPEELPTPQPEENQPETEEAPLPDAKP
jgi:NodT family efflux transporter outer membrane factor (OMF) lipoprotein